MEQLAPIFFVVGIFSIGALWIANSTKKSNIEDLNKDIDRLKKSAEQSNDQYYKGIEELRLKNNEMKQLNSEANNKIDVLKKYQVGLESLISEKSRFFPWLVTAFSDYQEIIGKQDEVQLRNKIRPAPIAAEKVKDATRRAVEAERGFRSLKYRIDLYEKYFPWITDVMGDTLEEFLTHRETAGDPPIDSVDDDPVRQFLSNPEYNALSATQRNQLAFDRWMKNRKSSWEIGRMYERFVGYEYEQLGFRVEYFGAIQGFDDLGRDLIVKKNGDIRIIQCKYWSKEKTVHEKHIFQLFGTVVEYIARANSRSDSLPLFETLSKLVFPT